MYSFYTRERKTFDDSKIPTMCRSSIFIDWLYVGKIFGPDISVLVSIGTPNQRRIDHSKPDSQNFFTI